jgi:hypothetical protein
MDRPVNGLLGDQIQQMYPWRVLVHQAFAEGRFPLWNPYAGGGVPLFANGQSAVLFPLNLAVLGMPPETAATAVQLVKPVLAGVGVALFLRALGASLLACLLGGVAWGFSGPMVVWLGWPHTNALLMVPYVFWTTTRWLQRGTRGWWCACAVVIAIQLLGGHPETTAHTMVVVGIYVACWVFVEVFARSDEGRRGPTGYRSVWLVSRAAALRGVGRIGGWLAAVAGGTALAGVQVVPLLSAISESSMAAEREVGGMSRLLLEPETALTWLVPKFFGTPLAETFGPLNFQNYNETVAYVGLGTLVLAGASCVATARPGWLGLALGTLVAFGLTYGLPGITELRRLPGLDYAANTRFEYFAAFGLACLAGLGLDACRGRVAYWVLGFLCLLVLAAVVLASNVDLLMPDPAGSDPLSPWQAGMWRRWELVGAAGLAAMWLGAVASALVFAWRNGPQEGVGGGLPGAAAVKGGGLMGAAAVKGGGLMGAAAVNGGPRDANRGPALQGRALLLPQIPWLAAAPVVALVCDLVLFGGTYNPVIASDVLRNVPASVAYVRQMDPTPRVLGLSEVLLPNASGLYGLSDLRVYEPIAHRRLLPFFERVEPAFRSDVRTRLFLFVWRPNVDLLSVAGVRWVFASRWDERTADPSLLAGQGLLLRYEDVGVSVWENPSARPRAYLASQVVAVVDEMEALDRLSDVRLTGPRGAVLDGDVDAVSLPIDTPSEDGEVQAEFGVGRVRARVSTAGARLLVVNDTYYPGWVASVDGRPAAIYRTNALFMGVMVPPGEHEVVLEYRPPSFAVGLVLSALAAALVAVLLCGPSAFRRLRRRGDEKPLMNADER